MFVSGPAEDCLAARQRIVGCLTPASPPQSPRSVSSFSVIDPPATAQATSRPFRARRDKPPSLHCPPGGRVQRISSIVLLSLVWVGLLGLGLQAIGQRPPLTRVLNLPAKLYIVLRAPGVQAPALVGSSAAYFDIVGRPFGQGHLVP